MEKKHIKIIVTILLAVSFLIIGESTYLYLSQHTNFIEQLSPLMIDSSIGILSWYIWIIGIGLFVICLILMGFKDFIKVVGLFLIEFIFIIGIAISSFGLIIPKILPKYRLVFFVSGFIIFYSVSKARKFYE